MNGKTYSLAMSALNTLSISPTLKTISYCAHRIARFRHRTKLKKSAKWMVWGCMTGRSLTSLHFIQQGQTATAEYYITKLLEKEVKPLFSRRSTTKERVKRKQKHEQKQRDLPIRWHISLYSESNPAVMQE